MANVRANDRHALIRAVLCGLAIGAALVATACTWSPRTVGASEAAAAQRLERYAELLQRQDSSAIAAMFEPDGSLGHQGQAPITGRVSIQAFLESFAGYKVLSHRMQLTSAVVQAHAVQQAGTYAQSVLTPDGRTLRVSGTFTATWVEEGSGEWLIRSMRTAPANGD